MKTIFGIAAGLAIMAATPAMAAHWNVDYAKSKLGFSVQWSNEPFTAHFASWKANIDFDPANLATSHADVTIDIGSEASDEADFDTGLKGAQGFATGQFPDAHFVAQSFSHKSGNDYVAQGTLTLKGVTKDVTLPFTLTVNGKQAHMVGTAHVMRSDFAIGQGQWAAPTPVSHDVLVNMDIIATSN
ncbi:MAG TPA: YceI family protein [Rhizomicrobium sp.]